MKSDTIIAIILTLVIGAGGYWYWSTRPSIESFLKIDTKENVSLVRFQRLVTELQSVSFDTGVLSDPRFVALVDLTIQSTPETTGRTDPFAPIPGVSLVR